MRVILLQDIVNVGRKGDVKDIKDGYARNFLIPRGFAKIATDEAIRTLEHVKKIDIERVEKESALLKEEFAKISITPVIIEMKASKNGILFKKIGKDVLVKELKKQEFAHISEDYIQLKEPIKKIGEYLVPIKASDDLSGELHIKISLKTN